jgi:Mn2+/Fe2+ NRAMP family transporter
VTPVTAGEPSVNDSDATLDRVDKLLGRVRSIMIALCLVGVTVAGTSTWLGAKSVGPGTRTDQLESKVDRNSVSESYRDSVLSFRVSRLERVVTTMAYQSCISDDKTPKSECAKIFTDGMN